MTPSSLLLGDGVPLKEGHPVWATVRVHLPDKRLRLVVARLETGRPFAPYGIERVSGLWARWYEGHGWLSIRTAAGDMPWHLMLRQCFSTELAARAYTLVANGMDEVSDLYAAAEVSADTPRG